ncbi:MAG: hypothetical protein IJY66_03495 [Clostridia bacterium]|nr:hypothetical protein [Clostridia bacterium]
MNQQLADAIRALPPFLQKPLLLGWLCLALSALAYWYFIRPALWSYIRAHASKKIIASYLPKRRSRIFFSGIRKKAHLERCGWYTVNLYLLPSLLGVALLHLVMTVLWLCGVSLPSGAETAHLALLSLLFFAIAVLSLISQPAATKERRTRWGFRPFGNTLHAALWEIIIVILLFLWFYVAYFLALL